MLPSAAVQTKKSYSGAAELPYTNLTSSLDDWSTDMAIMFYAPWCKYCKQLKPTWDQIAKITAPVYNDLSINIFNCEEPAANADLCAKLGIDRYPSIFYIGYSSFNQAPRGNPFGPSEHDGRIVRFTADLYPEAIYDWIRMLTVLSAGQRKYADVVGLLTGRGGHLSGRMEALARQNAALNTKVDVFSKELEALKADKLFDSVLDSGDPFAQLSQLTPSAANMAFRVCIGEMVSEYCKYHRLDRLDAPYCSIIAECTELNMEPAECRPKACPLNSRGCRVASACLQEDVIEAYNKAAAPTASSAGKARA